MSSTDLDNNVKITELLEDASEKYKIPAEFSHYSALCGLFPPSRNIIKHWNNNENVFLHIVKEQGKVGKEHFMQALVLYFIRKYNDKMAKYAPTFMKNLVEDNLMSDKFIIDWYDKNIRLDKESGLYDKKAEKKFRDLLE
mgnify:CR=1 FL=1